MFYQQIVKWIFIISCALMIALYFYKDKLPEPSTYEAFNLEEPLQTPTFREPFSIETNHQHYSLTPKFDYDLTGVVVSYSNADGFTNIWHHDLWKDFINVRDICVIWGKNVSTGVYKEVDFTSDSWTCWYTLTSKKSSMQFKSTAFSNNHLLVDNTFLASALLKAEIGDVVHFKGILVDYTNDENGGVRHTSTHRRDTGNGACEVVYLDDFTVIKKANPILRNFYMLTKWAAIFSFLGFVVLFVITPFEPR